MRCSRAEACIYPIVHDACDRRCPAPHRHAQRSIVAWITHKQRLIGCLRGLSSYLHDVFTVIRRRGTYTGLRCHVRTDCNQSHNQDRNNTYRATAQVP